ncbi:MAG: phage holin family protein [Prevotellaceae bacterium]|nr:phage holin family protein [Prevotellaceae bacterium]
MFSNDNNIETIAQLVEQAKKFVSLKSEYYRLSIVEKTVRLLTVLAMTFVLTALLLMALIYLSFALAFFLGNLIGSNACGFLVVGGIYMAVFVAFIIFRKKWIERPLVRFLASMLME